MIDGLRTRLGNFAELIADISEQSRFIQLKQVRYRMCYAPTCEMQQIVTIDAQGAQRELAKTLAIEKLVGPGYFLSLVVDQVVGGEAGRSSSNVNERDGHNDWACSIQ